LLQNFKRFRKKEAREKGEFSFVLIISSRIASVEEFGVFIRGHWKIENEFHWRMDVAFLQDKSTILQKMIAFNLLK
jgi:predicted transposase YbfD/YdcC